VRIFLIILAVLTNAGITFWQFSLVHKIWAALPSLAAVGIAAGCGIAVQLVLSHQKDLQPK
jgi:hypothetical protein